MAGQVLNLQLDDYTAERLASLARGRKVDVAQVAADALSLFVTLEEQPDQPHSWGEDDIAAIRRAIGQADRGELVPQSVVEREIDDLLR